MNGSTKSRDRDSHLRRSAGAAGDRRERPGADRPRGDRNGSDHGRDPQHAPPRPRRLGGSAAVERAKAHLTTFTGQTCEGVSSLTRTRDGWRVVLEVLELERIPRTTDILASYMVQLDEDGELMGYERIHRYYRNDVSGEQ